eukprot:764435-Hanusia_phi.AAC.2
MKRVRVAAHAEDAILLLVSVLPLDGSIHQEVEERAIETVLDHEVDEYDHWEEGEHDPQGQGDPDVPILVEQVADDDVLDGEERRDQDRHGPEAEGADVLAGQQRDLEQEEAEPAVAVPEIRGDVVSHVLHIDQLQEHKRGDEAQDHLLDQADDEALDPPEPVAAQDLGDVEEGGADHHLWGEQGCNDHYPVAGHPLVPVPDPDLADVLPLFHAHARGDVALDAVVESRAQKGKDQHRKEEHQVPVNGGGAAVNRHPENVFIVHSCILNYKSNSSLKP